MLLRRVAALGAAACMVSAPKLWVSTGRLYPTVPALGLEALPYPFDYVLFGLALAALAGMAVSGKQVFPAAFLGLAAVLVALDQSRLQPWLVQYAVMAGAALVGAEAAATRVFFVGLYGFAGLHKLNIGFAVMLSEMLRPLAERWGAQGLLTAKVLTPAAVVAALWECGWGIGLVLARTRRVAAVCLIAQHVLLLLLLGPLGLNINRSVWAWNVTNIVLLAVLFGKREQWDWKGMWRSHGYTRAVAAGVAAAGVLALIGWTDAYLGFGLYSGHTTTGALYVDPKRASDLPEPVRKLVKADGVLDINLWSIEELGLPVYPETRIYLAVGRQVAVWLRYGDAVRVIEFSRRDRFSGQRQARTFDPLTQ